MVNMEKLGRKLILKLSIISDFLKMLWKYDLWWSIPILVIMLFFMMLLLFAANTGVAAFIYPLF